MSELSRKMFLAETAAVREYLAEQEQQATAEAAPRPALDRATAVEPPVDQTAGGIRDQLLHAIDHAYTTGVLGYGTPEELLAAYDTSRTPQAADRAALRKVIAHAIHRYDNRHALSGNDIPSKHHYGEADAVLAVLPEPADRAAVLRWAAEELDARMERFFSEWPDEPRNSPYALGQKDAAAELRRMADETATTQTRAATTVPCSGALRAPHQPHNWEPQPGMEPVHCPGTRKPPMDPVHILGIDADDEPAAGARQDEPTALGLLPLLTSPEPCRWDGPVCTTHSWRSDIGRCPHAQAQALLGGDPR